MATINLAPETRYVVEQKRQRRVLFAISLGIGLLLALLWGALFATRAIVGGRLTETTNRIATVETEIAQLESVAERITLFEARTAALKQLTKTRLGWDPFLKEIERLLPASAVLTTLSVQGHEGAVQLTGVTPDLDLLAQALASLKDQTGHATLFSEASLRNATQQTAEAAANGLSGYLFNLKLTFDPLRLQLGQ